MNSPEFAPPWWLPGGHAQTIWPVWRARQCHNVSAVLPWRRERWHTPDGDFIDLDFATQSAAEQRETAPWLVVFHGLEGSSASPYAQALVRAGAARGWLGVVPHFRGCSGEINWGPRAYHSGDHEDIDAVLRRLRAQRPQAPLLAVGVSLGGNALLRWAQEAGEQASTVAQAVVAVSAPLDLAASGAAIDSGMNRWLYARRFLATMRQKARAKGQQYPGLFDVQRAYRARTLYEFDDAFTAPLHGFSGVDDYWQRAAARPGMGRIRVPSLVLNARNDPLVPGQSLPTVQEVSSHVTLWQPEHGGHVGFTCAHPGHPGGWHHNAMPELICQWLAHTRGASGANYG